MEIITSRENHFVKEYIKLFSSKKHRDNTGFFVIEGVKLIEEAFIQSVPFEMAFITKACYDRYSAMPEMQKLFQTVRTVIISDSIAGKLSDQAAPQGIFAIAKRLDNRLSIEAIHTKGKYLMLCDLQDPGNVGTIMRTAEALGIDGVIMTSACCDPYSPKVIRSSMGSSLRIPLCIVENINDTLFSLKKNGVFSYAGVVNQEAADVKSVLFNELSVMLIGNEGNGLTNEVVKDCDCPITIHMSGKAESLNASMAACILMWEMQSR